MLHGSFCKYNHRFERFNYRVFHDVILEKSPSVNIELSSFGLLTITLNMLDRCFNFFEGFFFSKNNAKMVEGSGRSSLNNTTTADESILFN